MQGALKLIVEPIFEADFQAGSYGYRPQRSAHDSGSRSERGVGNLRAIDRLALAALRHAANTPATTVSAGDVIAARKSLWP